MQEKKTYLHITLCSLILKFYESALLTVVGYDMQLYTIIVKITANTIEHTMVRSFSVLRHDGLINACIKVAQIIAR